MDLEKELFKLQDMKYQKFHSSLCPGIEDIIGVRVPEQRRLACELIKEDWKDFLNSSLYNYAEERTIRGLVIVMAPMPIKTKLGYLKKYIPIIDNWGTCDIVCTNFKDADKYQKEVLTFLQPCFSSKKEYVLRFGLVMLKCHFINKEHIQYVLSVLEKVTHDGYYAKMAIAWTIAECYIKFPKETMKFFKETNIDAWVYNKAIQKCRESFRVSKKDKEKLNKMKKQ